MRYGSGFLVLVFASASVWAQGNFRFTTTVAPLRLGNWGCPVGLSAKRQSSLEVRYAEGAREKSRGQGLELKIDARDASKKVVKASVTVHGVSGAARVMPVGESSRDDVAEIFQLGGGALFRSDIWTKRVGTIRWVDLTDIEYSDGSVWRTSQWARCRVEPDKFLLVAGAR
jgi:hypothetical protein